MTATTTGDLTGPYGRQPHRFAVDDGRYRSADHGWLTELDSLVVHAGAPQQRMATRAVDEADWLRLDGHLGSERVLRRRILAEARPEVSAAVPGSDAACGEAAELVASWLAAHHPDRAAVPGTPGIPAGVGGAGDAVGAGFTPVGELTVLERAALSIQEDLCLMERSPDDGGWRLTAGVVCFPSYWRLLEKLGHRQEAIHGPVPHYADELSGTVSRFFDRLRPGRIVSRRNWGFAAHPLLFVPQMGALDTADHHLPQDLWLRSERQTLRTLPGTGAIMFTIKVQLAPASALVDHPELASRLAEAIVGWSPAMLAMRGSRYGGVRTITAWLRSVADGSWSPVSDT